VTPRTSIGSAREDAARSRRRSSARRPAPRNPPRRFPRLRRNGGSRRRPLIILGTVAVGAAVGLWLANTETLQRTLLEVTTPLRHEDIIRQQATEKNVPPDLIAAVIWRESKFSDQTSSAGARGLMQITPRTAAEIEKLSGGETFQFDDLADPQLNISYGTFYLRHLLDLYSNNELAALAAYNAGPANVAEWGGASLGLDDIEFEETRDYVEDVLDKRGDYAEHYRDELGLDQRGIENPRRG
jgi:soluble lytic murein transglycosylase